MSRLYLVRHCQTAGQEPDAPLTDLGREQAARLADALADLGIRRIVSSPYARARASIEPLARRLGLPVETDARLIERVLCAESIPDWQDRLRASFDDLDLCLPGGESSRQAMERGSAVFRAVAEAGPLPAAIATHGNLLALLLRSLDGRSDFETWRRLSNPDVFEAVRRPSADPMPSAQPGSGWLVRRIWTTE